MELENAIMDSSQIAEFIEKHKRTLVEFNFEDVKLRQGDWDEALQPLTVITGSDSWKRKQEEVMDIPIMLSPVDIEGEPRIMGPLLAEEEEEEDQVRPSQDSERGKKEHTLSRWLSKEKSPKGKKSAKDSFMGSEHMKRFLRGTGIFQFSK